MLHSSAARSEPGPDPRGPWERHGRGRVRETLAYGFIGLLLALAGFGALDPLWPAKIGQVHRPLLALLWLVLVGGLGATLMGISLLRRARERSGEPIEPLTGPSWQRRLQRVSIRTKIVVPMIALATLPALGIGGVLISWTSQTLRHDVASRVRSDSIARAHGVGESHRDLEQDLRLLGQSRPSPDLAVALERQVEGEVMKMTRTVSAAVLMILALATALGALISEYLMLPLARLKRATRAIALGDLSRSVSVSTGDEVEELANDFNAMTLQLRRALDEQRSWRVQLEQEVAKQTRRVRDMERGMAQADKLASIGQLTAGVMHEIGNPLAAIKTRIQVAQQDEAAGSCRWLLADLIGEVDRLVAFLRSFSRLSRLPGPRKSAVDLRELAHGVASMLGAEAQRRGVRLRAETPEPPPTVSADPDQLRQVLMNLVLNAMDASGAGGDVLIRTLVSSERPDAGWTGFDVRDRGGGIPQEFLQKIWDPFFTTRESGTGLGLAVCRRIVTDHDGMIHVRNRVDGGAEFRVLLPAEDGRCIASRPGAEQEGRISA